MSKGEYLEAQSIFAKNRLQQAHWWRWLLVTIVIFFFVNILATKPRPIH